MTRKHTGYLNARLMRLRATDVLRETTVSFDNLVTGQGWHHNIRPLGCVTSYTWPRRTGQNRGVLSDLVGQGKSLAPFGQLYICFFFFPPLCFPPLLLLCVLYQSFNESWIVFCRFGSHTSSFQYPATRVRHFGGEMLDSRNLEASTVWYVESFCFVLFFFIAPSFLNI